MNEIVEKVTERFHRVLEMARGPRRVQQEAAKREPTPDEKLARSLGDWLAADEASLLVRWLNDQAGKANVTAHTQRASHADQNYALGQEAAYRAVAQRIRLIRGDK
jgi:hypothetical protein